MFLPLSLASHTGSEFTSLSPTVCNCSLDRRETLPSGPSATCEALEHLVSFICMSPYEILPKSEIRWFCQWKKDFNLCSHWYVYLVNIQLVQGKRSWSWPHPPQRKSLLASLRGTWLHSMWIPQLSWSTYYNPKQRTAQMKSKLNTTDPICGGQIPRWPQWCPPTFTGVHAHTIHLSWVWVGPMTHGSSDFICELTTQGSNFHLASRCSL